MQAMHYRQSNQIYTMGANLHTSEMSGILESATAVFISKKEQTGSDGNQLRMNMKI